MKLYNFCFFTKYFFIILYKPYLSQQVRGTTHLRRPSIAGEKHIARIYKFLHYYSQDLKNLN